MFRYKNGVPLGSGGRCRVKQDDDVYTLIMSDISDSDRGQITCELRNNLGTESCSCNLDVQCELYFSFCLIFCYFYKINTINNICSEDVISCCCFFFEISYFCIGLL